MRFMWCDEPAAGGKNVSGGGEVLQFTYGSNKGPGGTNTGKPLGCNSWKFLADGKWHNVTSNKLYTSRTIQVEANGTIDVCYDGVHVLSAWQYYL